MKKILMVFISLIFLMGCLVAGDEVVQPIAPISVTPAVTAPINTEAVSDITPASHTAEVVSDETGNTFSSGLWTFLNSSLGVSIVIFVLSFILGKIFTAKPKWKSLVLKYGPSLMQAVKSAEKKISDNTTNKGLAKLDEALQYLIKIEPKLKIVADDDIKRALTAVHAKAESSGNLGKE